MTTLIPENSNEEVVAQKKPVKKRKKITKKSFIINLYNGLPGREGGKKPFEPITDAVELARRVKEAEAKGYFTVKKPNKTNKQFLADVRWYLTDAAKHKLISREYVERPRMSAMVTDEELGIPTPLDLDGNPL